MPKNLLEDGTVLTLGLVGAVAAAGALANRSGSRSYMETMMREERARLLKSVGKHRIISERASLDTDRGQIRLHVGDILVPVDMTPSGEMRLVVWSRERDGARGTASSASWGGGFSDNDAVRVD
jgi:hypothetical protein